MTRGLVHHYFGGKRELYLEVVRSILRLPPGMFAAEIATGDPEAALGAAVDRWLDVAERSRGMLLATTARRASAATPRSRRSSTRRASAPPTR